MTFNPYKLQKYQLYLLQLENYELVRFCRLLIKKGWFPPREPQRKNLVWTAKARLIFIVAQTLHIMSCIVATWIFNDPYFKLIIFLIVLGVCYYFYFIFFILSLILIWPVDYLIKQIIVVRVKNKIKKLSINLDPRHFHSPENSGITHGDRGLKIIGIAGSYGKTTMKEVLKAVLGGRFKVLGTPESVNTPVGIARWVLNKVDDSTNIIIVEMGEHYVGDIEDICNITKPDIAVVTGINESHLERMKTMENVTATIFEIVSAAKPGAIVVLNGDDKKVGKNFKQFVWPDHRVEKFQISNFKFQIFDAEILSWRGQLEGFGEVAINLLGEYGLGDADAAVKIAKSLGMSHEEIKKGIAKIKPVQHRLEPIESNGILVIDDSYNGNPDGAAEAIKVLSRFISRRKIYITPGLVEMGTSSKNVHLEIGRQLAGAADVVILIKNSVTPFIEQGIRNQELGIREGKPEVIWFNTAQEAHAGLKNILKPGDVILFQNDWGDQYI